MFAGMARRKHTWVLLGLLSVLCPPIVSMLLFMRGDGYNPALFSDWDEPYYIVLPQRMTTESLRLPHEFLDICLGYVIRVLQISPISLAFFLDLACSAGAFLGVFWFFKLVANDRSERGTEGAVGAAVFMTLLPWSLSSVLFFLDQELRLADFLVTFSHAGFPSTPVERAFYTQISWICFAGFLCLLSRILITRAVSWVHVALLGILLGAALYIYFFLWAVLWFLLLFTVGLDWLLEQNAWKRGAMPRMILACCLGVLGALPGLSILFPAGALMKPGPAGDILQNVAGIAFRDVWFFAPTVFALVLVLAVQVVRNSRRQATSSTRVLALFALACLVGELLLMNAQPIVNRWLTPYHFALFYFHPLLTGLLVFVYVRWSSLARVTLCCIFLIGPTFALGRYIVRSDVELPEVEVLRYIDTQLPKGALVFTSPFGPKWSPLRGDVSYNLMPYWIDALTDVTSSSRLLGYESDREGVVQREIATAWVLSGKPSLLAECPDLPLSLQGNDLMNGVRTYFLMQRAVDCRLYNALNERATWQPPWPVGSALFLVLPNDDHTWDQRIAGAEELWRSSGGVYKIVRIVT